MAPCIGGLRTRLFRRIAILLLAFALLSALLLLTNPVISAARPLGFAFSASSLAPPTQRIPACAGDNRTASTELWRSLDSKYASLIEDKFTIVISTFHRPKELEYTLRALLAEEIPSLLEVVVLWNNFGEAPPDNYTSEHGVAVRYRVPARDSLNEKLRPDPEYRTRAILLSDDDVYYRSSDVEFVFQTWRKFSQDRVTGALARCAYVDGGGNWNYKPCARNGDAYSMVLTKLAFTHISFLDYYFSESNSMTRIRQIVDDNFNCEDIAFNCAVSMLTGAGPLQVRGQEQYVNLDPPAGISRDPNHLETRSKCLNDFAEVFSCMPLVSETGRVERGIKHNVWYKTLWDRIRP